MPTVNFIFDDSITEVRNLDKIFASKNGIVGLLENELYDMQKTKKPLELLLESPAGMFGSCRYKLPGLEDEDFYKSLFAQLEKYEIKYFFYSTERF